MSADCICGSMGRIRCLSPMLAATCAQITMGWGVSANIQLPVLKGVGEWIPADSSRILNPLILNHK